MNLPEIRQEGEKLLVSAKELYQYLGFASQHWAKWYNTNIIDNAFACESEDWEQLPLGGRSIDFAITVDFAKRLAMMARTEKGEEARRYFIKCESNLNKRLQYKLPITHQDALRQLIEEIDAKEKAQKELEMAQPKIEFFDQVTDSKDAIDIGSASKVLDLGIGRNAMFDFLRKNKILMNTNIPYQSYVDQGWFKVVESKYNKPDGSTHISIKTLVHQKGLDGILRLHKKNTSKNLSSL